MFNFQKFDEVFDFDPECSYDSDTIHEIEAHRKSNEGLFIDRILKLVGIKRPVKYYPPKSNNTLRDLHKVVCDSDVVDHLKLSILYYLLIDFDAPTGRRDYSTAFEQSAFLPKKYGTYMKGLWHIDRSDFEDALQYLTHPSVLPTFSDEILEVLVRKSKDLSLPLAYYYTVRPNLKSKEAIECLFSSIARTSVTEAFFYAREQTIYAHRHMFEMLIALVLNNSPQDQLADRATELVGLPFDQEEEEWFDDYLARGEGTRLRRAKDTLMMRRIGTGKFKEGLEMKELRGMKIGGLDWGVLTAGVEKGVGSRLDL